MEIQKIEIGKLETRKTIRSFEDLFVWQKSHQLMLDIYRFSSLLPIEEKYNRRSQLVRSASSISANIAEGFGRFHYQENIQFCRQARGSLTETRNHIIAARDLQQAPLLECEKLLAKCEETLKLLNGYITKTKILQKNSRQNDKLS